MRAPRSMLPLLLLGALLPWAQDPQPQDPQPQDPRPERPPAPPPDAAPLPVVEEPWVAPVLRQDLPGRFTPPDPAEGVWRLRARSVAGQPQPAGQGLLVIGRQHLQVHCQAPGAAPDVPLLRAGTYRWRRVDNLGGVQLTTLFGHFNQADGDVVLLPAGAVQRRRLMLLDGAIRIEQGPGDWLEFERAE